MHYTRVGFRDRWIEREIEREREKEKDEAKYAQKIKHLVGRGRHVISLIPISLVPVAGASRAGINRQAGANGERTER